MVDWLLTWIVWVFVAHIAEIQAFGIVSIDRVRTVGIGSRAFRGTGDGDGDTYEGISRVVFNDTRDGLPPPLCRGRERKCHI